MVCEDAATTPTINVSSSLCLSAFCSSERSGRAACCGFSERYGCARMMRSSTARGASPRVRDVQSSRSFFVPCVGSVMKIGNRTLRIDGSLTDATSTWSSAERRLNRVSPTITGAASQEPSPRRLPGARDIAEELTSKGVALRLGWSIRDPTDPVGRLLFNVLGMVAEFEADLIRMRTRDGTAVAKAKGV